ncbi:MAG: GNAT family N-acetyltransferase [Pseudomonadota bacterium]
MTTPRVTRTDDIEACLALRRTVFIEEQNVPEEIEMDDRDGEAIHLLARRQGAPIGTARVLAYGSTIKIGRVCVLAAHRGGGIGVALIEACHAEGRQAGATRAILSAQLPALSFYERLGYRAYGEVFVDAGIDHCMMEISL